MWLKHETDHRVPVQVQLLRLRPRYCRNTDEVFYYDRISGGQVAIHLIRSIEAR